MSKTNTGLVAYAKAMIGHPYWYGCYGQISSYSLYLKKKSQYPKYYTDSNYNTQYGTKVHDCVGLIKGYLWSETTSAAAKYTSSQDVSASGMYSKSKEKGKISTIPAISGILVYKGTTTSSIHHVGVYGNDGYVYEAKGHAYGTVKTPFVKSDWQYWSKCPFITYETEAVQQTTSTKSNDEIAAEVIAGKWGTGDTRKTKLTQAGYDYSTIQALVNAKLKGTTTTTKTIAVGSKVKMQSGAPVYGKTTTFAKWVYTSTLYVRSISGSRVVVSTQATGAVTGAVDIKYLTLV